LILLLGGLQLGLLDLGVSGDVGLDMLALPGHVHLLLLLDHLLLGFAIGLGGGSAPNHVPPRGTYWPPRPLQRLV
jgi:hypothetical protein